MTELPVPTNVPPQLPEYQFQSAPVPSEPPLTVSTLELPEHIGLTDAPMPVGATEFDSTVMVCVGAQSPNV